MNLSRFIALRIYRNSEPGKQVSRPAVLIAMVGIALGLAVMIIAVSVIVGFKSEVRDKIVGFGAHIQIGNLDAARSYETRPVVVGDSMMAALSDYPEVKHVQRYSTKPGMIKTADAFQGMVLKGVGQEYDSTFFHRHLLEGEFPQFSDIDAKLFHLLIEIRPGKFKCSRCAADIAVMLQQDVSDMFGLLHVAVIRERWRRGLWSG